MRTNATTSSEGEDLLELLQGRRLLIVEDDPDQVIILRKLLGETGAELQHCDDGDAAWKCLQEESFDLVVLDVMLPGKDGWEIFSDLRNLPHGRNTPVLFLTCLIDERDEERASDPPHHCMTLSKPMRRDDFFSTVRQLLMT